jgi:hypothetical protein
VAAKPALAQVLALALVLVQALALKPATAESQNLTGWQATN